MSETRPTDEGVPTLRAFCAGILMGLANLVPGISGGTMILAVGLYDRFIGAVADLTRLRLRRESLLFLATLGLGLAVAILIFSGLAVAFVGEYRWIAYSLFIGMTLGGAPELWRRCRPLSLGVVLPVLAGAGLMVALALELSGTQLPSDIWVLVLVGAAAASSMILPGISGSYVLLILGMYDTVIGSLSSSALREDFGGSLAIILPVGVGAAIGIGLLSNVLERLLQRHSRVSHAALLGLLVGSVVGLYPYRQPVDLELAHKPTRKAVALVIQGVPLEQVQATFGDEVDAARVAALSQLHAGASAGDLKQRGEALETFEPSGGQIGAGLGFFVLGAIVTRLLGKRPRPGAPVGLEAKRERA